MLQRLPTGIRQCDRRAMAGQLAALAHARDAARDAGAGIARGRADLEAVLRAEIQARMPSLDLILNPLS